MQKIIYNKLKASFPTATKIDVSVQDSAASIYIIDSIFEGLSMLKKQKLVYKSIDSCIADNSIHAVKITTLAKLP
jgi:acid stress-induced BolA-like protein IbaG/YrbA